MATGRGEEETTTVTLSCAPQDPLRILRAGFRGRPTPEGSGGHAWACPLGPGSPGLLRDFTLPGARVGSYFTVSFSAGLAWIPAVVRMKTKHSSSSPHSSSTSGGLLPTSAQVQAHRGENPRARQRTRVESPRAERGERGEVSRGRSQPGTWPRPPPGSGSRRPAPWAPGASGHRLAGGSTGGLRTRPPDLTAQGPQSSDAGSSVRPREAGKCLSRRQRVSSSLTSPGPRHSPPFVSSLGLVSSQSIARGR